MCRRESKPYRTKFHARRNKMGRLMYWFSLRIRRAATPVIDTAFIIIIWAWNVGIKSPHTHPFKHPIICRVHLALVISCAMDAIIAWLSILWNAHADSKVAVIRLYCLAEARALVAHSKVKVIIITARRARLAWYRDAPHLLLVAAVQHTQDDASFACGGDERIHSKRSGIKNSQYIGYWGTRRLQAGNYEHKQFTFISSTLCCLRISA
jgi:hypothetical protein